MTVRSLLSVAALSSFLASPLACSSDDGGGSTNPGYTVDNVCAQTVPKICSARKSCCETAKLTYEQAGCESREKTECDKNVAEVKAGTMTFDGSKVDACVAKYTELLNKCYLTFSEITTFINDFKICQVFVGRVPVGGACERTAQCAPATGNNEQVACTNNKCVLTKLLPEGAACKYEMGVTEYCGANLFCDADFTKMPIVGTCKPSLAIGADCSTKPFGCGLGNRCDMATKKCVEGKAEGAMCANDLECKSLSCATTCQKGDPLVEQKECNGK